MGKNPLILTFDCGTQSVRALLFDKKGICYLRNKSHMSHMNLSPAGAGLNGSRISIGKSWGKPPGA